jgi:hypothetical protein
MTIPRGCDHMLPPATRSSAPMYAKSHPPRVTTFAARYMVHPLCVVEHDFACSRLHGQEPWYADCRSLETIAFAPPPPPPATPALEISGTWILYRYGRLRCTLSTTGLCAREHRWFQLVKRPCAHDPVQNWSPSSYLCKRGFAERSDFQDERSDFQDERFFRATV